jgi:hypothetical protein
MIGLAMMMSYNLAILYGAAYLVDKGWSAWTFLPAVLLMATERFE